MREIDHSPENIKQLSQMMADNIAKMLQNEIDRINTEERPATRRSAVASPVPIHPSPVQNGINTTNPTSHQIAQMFKIDLTPYTKTGKNGKVHPEVKDEKFTMDNFFNTIRDVQNG